MSNEDTDDLRPEYPPKLISLRCPRQVREAVPRGFKLIDPDLARAFPNAKAVNDALRQFLAEHETIRNLARRSSRRRLQRRGYR